jgi:hypothetical protein
LAWLPAPSGPVLASLPKRAPRAHLTLLHLSLNENVLYIHLRSLEAFPCFYWNPVEPAQEVWSQSDVLDIWCVLNIRFNADQLAHRPLHACDLQISATSRNGKGHFKANFLLDFSREMPEPIKRGRKLISMVGCDRQGMLSRMTCSSMVVG